MANYNVKIYNSDLEIYEYNIKASSEAVARMRALTMYHTYCNRRFTFVRKIKITEKKR